MLARRGKDQQRNVWNLAAAGRTSETGFLNTIKGAALIVDRPVGTSLILRIVTKSLFVVQTQRHDVLTARVVTDLHRGAKCAHGLSLE